MRIVLNNKKFEIKDGATVSTLAETLELPKLGVAIAVNNEVISRSDWDKTVLQEGVEIMLTQAVCGG